NLAKVGVEGSNPFARSSFPVFLLKKKLRLTPRAGYWLKSQVFIFPFLPLASMAFPTRAGSQISLN
ncbi:hypothetical protein, partial [uncultured Rhizobium sp.]|uniref:hypothetical protein n=1 Tax=uncultured Rhizobium sp. TaxID=155567 RepID=UPI00262FF3AB